MRAAVIIALLMLCVGAFAQEKTGIVYATKSGIIRRVIVPTNDTELTDPRHAGRGETLIIVDRKSLRSLNDIEAAVAKSFGKKPADSRCVVVDEKTAMVVGNIHCDPELDALPDLLLLLHESLSEGDYVGDIIRELKR